MRTARREAHSAVQAEPTPAAVRITAIGDSVLGGAVYEFQKIFSNIEVDSVEGRQIAAVIEDLQARRAAGTIGEIVVIHVGNNGIFTADQFHTIMELLAGTKRVVWLNIKLPADRTYQRLNNAMLAEAVKGCAKCVLIDWSAASADHPEYFWEGIHLRQTVGDVVYVRLISEAINRP